MYSLATPQQIRSSIRTNGLASFVRKSYQLVLDHANVLSGNTRYVQFVGDNGDGEVTLILKNAETDVQVGNWTQPNKLGRYSLAVDDRWWDSRAVDLWEGEPRNWTFYWEIIPATHTIDGGEERQPTFVVVQTALPNSALSSYSASIISESLASVSRSIESTDSQASQQSRDASLQSSQSESSFPPWAIALIVVLGVISIVSILTLFFVLIRGMRRKRRSPHRRESIGSESPMMQQSAAPHSPAAASAVRAVSPSLLPPIRSAPSIRYNDSIASRTSAAGEAVITGSDAAIMADAFRKALRKPDFADRPQEDRESPKNDNFNEQEEALLSRELAEEGKNIRSVSSERVARVVQDDESPGH